MTQDEAEYLVRVEPAALLAALGRPMPPHELTFAAEIAGAIEDSRAVRAALVPLLLHPDAVVREGALYGIACHLDDDTKVLLFDMADHDPSPAVRAVAKECLQ